VPVDLVAAEVEAPVVVSVEPTEVSGAASPFPWKDFPSGALRFPFPQARPESLSAVWRQMPIWRCLRRILRRIRSVTIW